MFSFGNKPKDNVITLAIPNRTVVRVLLLVVATMLGLAALQKASSALILIFVAFFLALALNAPVHWLSQRLPGKRKGSRSVATAISFLVIIVLLGGFLASIVPPLVKQTNNFIQAVPGLIEEAKDKDSTIGQFVHRYDLEKQVQDLSNEADERIKDVGGIALSTAGQIGTSIFALLTVLVLTFMMLVEGPRWVRLFEDLTPDDHKERSRRLAKGMYQVIRGYVNGQVLLASIAAVFILPVLIILDISYPVALMVVVFICGLIPMVGHSIGAVFVSLVALFTSPWAALIVLGYYFLYQQIENYLVQPRIQANATNMSPLLVFASVIIGANFAGILGGLVAIPVAGCLRIVALDYLQKKHIMDTEDNELTAAAPEKKK
jgi:predicted PurR-regulated permease PerM